ncbi:unnamed protein product, partial [Caretta caretta]
MPRIGETTRPWAGEVHIDPHRLGLEACTIWREGKESYQMSRPGAPGRGEAGRSGAEQAGHP